MTGVIVINQDTPIRKTVKLAQLFICNDSPCGSNKKSAPSHYKEIKSYIKTKGMKSFFRIQKSKCLGVCKPSNVILVITREKPIWLANMRTQDHYDSLLRWLEECYKQDTVVEMPATLQSHIFERILPKRN